MKILVNPEIFDDEKRIIFLKFIVDLVENFPDFQLIWNTDYFDFLFSGKYPNATNLYNNYSDLMSRVFSKFWCCEQEDIQAKTEPQISFKNKSTEIVFLKILHSLIINKNDDLPFINNSDDVYDVSCTCHQQTLKTFSVKTMQDYVRVMKHFFYLKFWPQNKVDFDSNFNLLLKIREYEVNFFAKDRKYRKIKYSSSFKNDVINFPPEYREKFIENFVLRLHLYQKEAHNSSLNDEPIINTLNRRFYITKAHGRIHYCYEGKDCIKFIQLSLDHDRGLG